MKRVGADHHKQVGAVDVAYLGRDLGPCQLQQRRALRAAAGTRVQVRGAQGLAEDPLDQEAFLVAGVADDGGAPGPGVAQAGRGALDRLRPARLAQVAALADHRCGDPFLRAEHLERVAALVAEPAVVDLGVVAGQHPLHLLVADGEADVALGRTEGADRAALLDVPGPGAEAVGVGGQRPDRAELGDVAVERRDVGPVVVGADEGVVAALQQLQLGVLGDLLAEADAAVAEDAALAVDRDQRRQRQGLLEVALGIGEAAAPRAPAHRDVLQRALAALVADRAVERVVDEQELDHRVLRLLDLVGLGVDDHPVARRGRAGGLKLRRALDLDQAHPAGPDRLAELRLVTEDRDLDVAVLGRVDQHRALRSDDLAPVDDQGDVLGLRTHKLSPVRARPRTRLSS